MTPPFSNDRRVPSVELMRLVTQIPEACPNDCPDTCALLAIVEHGVATRMHGNPDLGRGPVFYDCLVKVQPAPRRD